MSTHFRISLGLIVAGCLHFVVLNNYELNQSVTYPKKEQSLSIILTKIPKNQPIFEMPVEMPIEIPSRSVIEKKPIQPQKPPKTKSKAKLTRKTNKKQAVKKQIIEKKTLVVKETDLNTPEITQETPLNKIEEITQETETSNVEFQESYQETKKEKTILKTVSCASYSYCPKPHYPFVAKQRGIEGWVKLTLKIDETGSVIDAKILASEPEDIFEEAALEAVLQWRNLPEQLFNSTVEQTIKFNLNN